MVRLGFTETQVSFNRITEKHIQSETGHAGILTCKPNSTVLNVQGLHFIPLLSTCTENVEPLPTEASLFGVEW